MKRLNTKRTVEYHHLLHDERRSELQNRKVELYNTHALLQRFLTKVLA